MRQQGGQAELANPQHIDAGADRQDRASACGSWSEEKGEGERSLVEPFGPGSVAA
jgi:hypothetical protein